MNVKIGRSKIISVLTLVWGVTATMPALQIGGSAVSNYIMIVIIALSLQKFIITLHGVAVRKLNFG